MPNITVSADIHTFLQSTNVEAARSTLITLGADLNQSLRRSILDRTVGLTANATTKNYWLTMDHTGAGNYVKNPDCWAYGVDISWCSVAADDSNTGSGAFSNKWECVAISATWLLIAYHILSSSSYAAGTRFRFVDTAGEVITRTLTGTITRIGSTDIALMELSAPLPDTVRIAKFIPPDVDENLFNNWRVLLIKSSSAFSFTVASPGDTASFPDIAESLARPSNGGLLDDDIGWTNFFTDWVGGDSSSFVGVLDPTQGIIISGLAVYPTTAQHLAPYFTEIEAVIGTAIQRPVWISKEEQSESKDGLRYPVSELIQTKKIFADNVNDTTGIAAVTGHGSATVQTLQNIWQLRAAAGGRFESIGGSGIICVGKSTGGGYAVVFGNIIRNWPSGSISASGVFEWYNSTSGASWFTATPSSTGLTFSSGLSALSLVLPPSALTPTTGSVVIDFSTNDVRTHALSGNVTYTTSNLVAGATTTVRIVADGSTRTFTFPAWKFVGAAAPTSIAASKTAILTITSFGTTDADCVAAYAVEP